MTSKLKLSENKNDSKNSLPVLRRRDTKSSLKSDDFPDKSDFITSRAIEYSQVLYKLNLKNLSSFLT